MSCLAAPGQNLHISVNNNVINNANNNNIDSNNIVNNNNDNGRNHNISNEIVVGNLNVRSIASPDKLDKLRDFANATSASIMVLTETWLNKNTTEDL